MTSPRPRLIEQLRGHNAIVVGVSPNIGTGLALSLAEAGAHVWAFDRDENNAVQCAQEIRDRGGSADPLVADSTDEPAVERAVAHAWRRGPVDVLVNAAGIYRSGGVLDMAVEDWTDQLAVILTGAFVVTRSVARRLVEDGRAGSVINIASTAAHQGQLSNVGYCTAKAGILNFTRAAAMDLAPHGIRVNTLTPTGTDIAEGRERFLRWGRPDPLPRVEERQRHSRALSPLGELPAPHDYGEAAVFLASDAARMITGTELRVDAGMLARYWADAPAEGTR